jgi:hypothetical protein
MSELKSRPLFDISITVDPPQDLGATPLGMRRIVTVTGGSFKGERVSGIIMPNAAADWILIRTDGSIQLDVRMILKTDDDELIYMNYHGIRNSSAEVSQRMWNGELVDPSEYYFRTAPVFETGATKYAWMNNIISVGIGERVPTEVRYKIYEIL